MYLIKFIGRKGRIITLKARYIEKDEHYAVAYVGQCDCYKNIICNCVQEHKIPIRKVIEVLKISE